jgi:hypothetical protein
MPGQKQNACQTKMSVRAPPFSINLLNFSMLKNTARPKRQIAAPFVARLQLSGLSLINRPFLGIKSQSGSARKGSRAPIIRFATVDP